MKVTVIGTGYVGLVTGACLAELGNHVLCVDVDAAKVELLNRGGIPIHEPGLPELVESGRASGHLKFTTRPEEGVAHGDVIFIAVGTPPDEDGSADLKYVLAVAQAIGRSISRFAVVIDKSTVPVGTAERVDAAIRAELGARGIEQDFAVVSNPEFLKEGAAVGDFMRPDRIVLGVPDGPTGARARAMLNQLYAPFQRNHERTIFMDLRSAELTKYAANAMLATRISFMNELANLADRLGADIELVRRGIGSDPRIGYDFLYAGTGYGGSCFPKDLQALMRTARDAGARLRILEAVDQVNSEQKEVLWHKIAQRFGKDLGGRTFAVWGLAFKPNTDDMREAASRGIVARLLEAGAGVRAFDPIAIDEAKRVFALDLAGRGDLLARLAFTDGPEAALDGADALVIVTEWKVFRSPDFDRIKASLKQPVIFDGRNLYDPQRMRELGFSYIGVGRGSARSGGAGDTGASQ